MNNGGIAWFARNPVAANLMMVFIMVSGLIAHDHGQGGGLSGGRARPHQHSGALPGGGAGRGRGRGRHPHRGGDSGRRRHQGDPVHRIGGQRVGHGRAGARRRCPAGGRRGQEQRRRDHDVSDRDRETHHPGDDRPQPGHRHLHLRRNRHLRPEGAGRAGSRRVDRDARDHAGRRGQRAALRNLDRGVRGRAAAARNDVRPGRRRRASLVAGPARRLGPHRRRRDSPAHDRPGLPRQRVRGSGALDARRRKPAAPGRRGDGRRRLRRDRSAGPVRSRAHGARVGLPHRRFRARSTSPPPSTATSNARGHDCPRASR